MSGQFVEARDFQTRLERLDALLREAAHFADPAARSCLQEIVQTVLELHGEGLNRLLDHAAEAGDGVLTACLDDDVVSGLLLLHGLHPLGVEERVRQALDSVRPYLRSHGGNVELLAIEGDVVRLQLHGSCHHCPSSSVTMQQTVEAAIQGRAPEITSVEVAGLETEATAHDDGRLTLPLVGT